MENDVEHIRKYQRLFWVIGLWLCVFTVLTVWLSHVEFYSHKTNILIGMVIAAFKSTLVALIFMHLKGERKLVYKLLVFTAIFFSSMFVLFTMAYYSRLNHLL